MKRNGLDKRSLVKFLYFIPIFVFASCNPDTLIESQETDSALAWYGQFLALNNTGRNSELISTSFSPDGSMIATLDTTGDVTVVNTNTGTIKAKKHLGAKDMIFLRDGRIAGFVGEDTGLWKIWTVEEGSIVEFSCPLMRSKDDCFVGLVDRRSLRTDSEVFVSTGESLAILDLDREEISKVVLDWRELYRIYGTSRLTDFENPTLLAETKMRWAMPTVFCKNGQHVLLNIDQQDRFVISLTEDAGFQLIGTAIIAAKASGFLADFGENSLTYIENPLALDMGAAEKAKYAAYNPPSPKNEMRAVVSTARGVIVDFPNRHAPGEGHDEHQILRISDLDSGEELAMFHQGDHQYLNSVGGTSDLQMSPCGQFVSFKVNPGSIFCRTLLLDLRKYINN